MPKPHFQSIVLRRERPDAQLVVTGATVRYSDGTFDRVDCLADRFDTIVEIEYALLVPLLSFRIVSATPVAVLVIDARDRDEALALARHYGYPCAYVDRVEN